jgi:hypothetical protein
MHVFFIYIFLCGMQFAQTQNVEHETDANILNSTQQHGWQNMQYLMNNMNEQNKQLFESLNSNLTSLNMHVDKLTVELNSFTTNFIGPVTNISRSIKQISNPFSDYIIMIQWSVYTILSICTLLSFSCIICCMLYNNPIERSNAEQNSKYSFEHMKSSSHNPLKNQIRHLNW